MSDVLLPSIDVTTVVLHGIDWNQSTALAAALSEYHPRCSYDGSDFELNRVLPGVTWPSYTEFLAALGDYRLRHSYDGWTLEMMSPRKDHERAAHLIGRLIEQMTLELGVGIQSVGSMTISNPAVQRAVQPDQSYYVTHEPQVRERAEFDATIDPPPDLIVEVDVSHSSESRMPVFAALKIPEVWRYDGKDVLMYRLGSQGAYDTVTTSMEFPWLSCQDLLDHLQRQNTLSENELVIQFAKAMRLKYQAWQASPS